MRRIFTRNLIVSLSHNTNSFISRAILHNPVRSLATKSDSKIPIDYNIVVKKQQLITADLNEIQRLSKNAELKIEDLKAIINNTNFVLTSTHNKTQNDQQKEKQQETSKNSEKRSISIWLLKLTGFTALLIFSPIIIDQICQHNSPENRLIRALNNRDIGSAVKVFKESSFDNRCIYHKELRKILEAIINYKSNDIVFRNDEFAKFIAADYIRDTACLAENIIRSMNNSNNCCENQRQYDRLRYIIKALAKNDQFEIIGNLAAYVIQHPSLRSRGILELLLKKAKNSNPKVDPQMKNRLFAMAINQGNLALIQVLYHNGANVNRQEGEFLRMAIKNGSEDVVGFLLGCGAMCENPYQLVTDKYSHLTILLLNREVPYHSKELPIIVRNLLTQKSYSQEKLQEFISNLWNSDARALLPSVAESGNIFAFNILANRFSISKEELQTLAVISAQHNHIDLVNRLIGMGAPFEVVGHGKECILLKKIIV